MKTDRDMSTMAEQNGFYEALLHYAAEEFVKFNDNDYPAVGKAAFEEKVAGRPGTKLLQWTPVHGEVARSGELGYTWGNWELHLKDTVMYGNYFSVWKRGMDGSWKLALDGGNTTPAPK